MNKIIIYYLMFGVGKKKIDEIYKKFNIDEKKKRILDSIFKSKKKIN